MKIFAGRPERLIKSDVDCCDPRSKESVAKISSDESKRFVFKVFGDGSKRSLGQKKDRRTATRADVERLRVLYDV